MPSGPSSANSPASGTYHTVPCVLQLSAEPMKNKVAPPGVTKSPRKLLLRTSTYNNPTSKAMARKCQARVVIYKINIAQHIVIDQVTKRPHCMVRQRTSCRTRFQPARREPARAEKQTRPTRKGDERACLHRTRGGGWKNRRKNSRGRTRRFFPFRPSFLRALRVPFTARMPARYNPRFRRPGRE